MKYPVSPKETICGLVYFRRMVDKIRLHAAGELGEDYIPNLGEGFDDRCCKLLRISYKALTAEVKKRNAAAAAYVHWGATSQDVVDTALMLELREAIDALARNVAAGRLSFSTEVGRHMATSQVVFVCVGTPMRKDGGADLSAVDRVAEQVLVVVRLAVARLVRVEVGGLQHHLPPLRTRSLMRSRTGTKS